MAGGRGGAPRRVTSQATTDRWAFLSGVVRYPYAHAEKPALDNFLTMCIAAWILILLVSVRHDPARYLELLADTLLFVAFVAACKAAFTRIGRAIITPTNLKNSRNLRKFSDQSWQLVIHTIMTAAEYYLLSREPVRWDWYHHPESLAPGGMWDNRVDQAGDDPELRTFYLAQLVVWSVTAVSHRFYEARHKDYFVMYSHHVATVALIGGSYFLGSLRIGLLVLFLHDSSDIFVDLLKMANYAGLDADAGYYITEVCFAVHLGAWAYARLYLYPIIAVMAAWRSVAPFSGGDSPMQLAGLYLMDTFLSFLYVLHVWWYYLFLRILWRLLNAEPTHNAGREEYEGSSASETEDVQADTAKTK